MRLLGQALIVCCCLVAPAFAHHGGGIEYFMDQTRGPVTGTVTAFAFTFPHPLIEFDVKTESGAMRSGRLCSSRLLPTCGPRGGPATP